MKIKKIAILSFLALLFITGCGEKEKTEETITTEIKKEVTPTFNLTTTSGKAITITANKEAIAKKSPIKKQPRSKLAPEKKRLASNGKQDWISNKTSEKKPKKSKTSLILLAISAIILGITGLYFTP